MSSLLALAPALLLTAAPVPQDVAAPSSWQPVPSSQIEQHFDRWRTLTGPLAATGSVELVIAEVASLDCSAPLEGLRLQLAEQLSAESGRFEVPSILGAFDELLDCLPDESADQFSRTRAPVTVYQGDGYEARVDHRPADEAVLVKAVRTRELMVLQNQYPEGVGEQFSLRDPAASPLMMTVRDLANPLPGSEHDRSVLRAGIWDQRTLPDSRIALRHVRVSASGRETTALFVIDTRHGLPELAALFPWGPGEPPHMVTALSYAAGPSGLLQPARIVQAYPSGGSVQISDMRLDSVEWGSHTFEEFEFAPGEFAVLYDDRAGSRKYFGWADKLGWPAPIQPFLEMSAAIASPPAAVDWLEPGIPFAGNRDEHGHPVGEIAEAALGGSSPAEEESSSSRRLLLLFGGLLTCGGLAFASRQGQGSKREGAGGNQ